MLDNPTVMESLCYSAAEKSEGTLNASNSFTNGVCKVQRFHTEDREQTCRALITTNALVCTICSFLVGSRLLCFHGETIFSHDLITHVFLRSLQYGIMVVGFIDAFVYAHHQHRRGIENPRNFGDCMKGRIRFMTAITPAYAHAYWATCLTRHMPAFPRQNFRLPKPEASFPYLPNARSTTRERGNDYR